MRYISHMGYEADGQTKEGKKTIESKENVGSSKFTTRMMERRRRNGWAVRETRRIIAEKIEAKKGIVKSRGCACGQ